MQTQRLRIPTVQSRLPLVAVVLAVFALPACHDKDPTRVKGKKPTP